MLDIPAVIAQLWIIMPGGPQLLQFESGVKTHLRIGQAAELLRVSPDTVRRLVDSGHIKTGRSTGGQRQVDGPALARYMSALPRQDPPPAASESARNRFVGIVTRVIKDGVAAQVEMQAGPYRIVSLIT